MHRNVVCETSSIAASAALSRASLFLAATFFSRPQLRGKAVPNIPASADRAKHILMDNNIAMIADPEETAP